MQLFDLHCDSIVNFRKENEDFLCKDTQFSLSDLKQFKRICQTMAVFIPDTIRGEAALRYFQEHKEYLDLLLRKQSQLASKATSAAEIEAITDTGKCAVLLAVESGAALAGRLENVDYLYECGVRMMTLVWNGENELGSGHDTDHGLTEFGRRAIRRMEKTGMLVDVSHLNDRGFDEVCEVAKKPFIATHSNVRAVCPHKRNLTDVQFQEIVRRKGLVGVNLFRNFLSEDHKDDLDSMYRHVDHMLELGGKDVIACGSDFDGAEIDEKLDSPAKFAASGDYLLTKGIPEQIINKMFYENALDFFYKNI
ncbi:dipeptidase [Hespellia stercorisuis]|uniref:Membrane dipeptidase n=1 Tax=Hespellia stercorisuis DSM 15480 TaxID=1121950 RepID=A0A1M6IC94_9FIRM|nr:dipeptidase [Hespellia stercorisuis]SHJ32109.1 membrane dipeptidase [Hespellia stercorisuis DSM 15480]